MHTIKLPGLIDPHVHLRDPGQTEKEDFFTGTAAALFGGFTTVLDMPNNKTPITTASLLDEKINCAQEKTVCDIGFYFGSMGDNISEFPKVKNKVKGLKLYLNETTGNFLIDKKKLQNIFEMWKGSPILLHAEDDAVESVITIVRRTKTRAHFCHISTQSDLTQIIKAKKDNLPISCGVTPHHLFLTEHDEKQLGSLGKMKPYLKSKRDVQFLWDNLQFIDMVESDHAPHTIEEKKQPYHTAPYGVPGLETTLPLLLTAVSEKRLTIEDIIRLCHDNPKRIFLASHYDNTYHYSEIDLNTTWEINNDNLFTKCKWSPFHGWKVTGKIRKVFFNNKKVIEDSSLHAKPGSGTIL